MTVKDLTLKFITNPSYLGHGAGKLATRLKCSKDDIYRAKEEARKHLHAAEVAELQDVVTKQESQLARYIGSETTQEGIVRKFETTRPLTPKEIESLVGVDGITTTVARVWDKLQPNGRWTYSVDVRYREKDFYNSEELVTKLEEIVSEVEPYRSSPVKNTESKALMILLADDHVGAVNTSNMFCATDLSYKERLSLIMGEVRGLGLRFEEIHLVSLGDQLNGWNSQTTRGGHEVKSLSNKEQFDIYTSARIEFYESLFSSKLSEKFYVHDIENSNHSGLGMSYIANQFLDIYLKSRFPTVIRKSYHEIIDYFQYGEHSIIIGHGKDEKFMTRPMPAVLDAKTDLYLFNFSSKVGITPDDNITFYKGDLHQHGLQYGKFGRYVNVPSIAGNSDFGDANFGGTRGGALLEILDKNSYRIQSQAIWF